MKERDLLIASAPEHRPTEGVGGGGGGGGVVVGRADSWNQVEQAGGNKRNPIVTMTVASPP